MHPLLAIVGITTLVSVLGLIGGFFLLWKRNLVRRWSGPLISFAAGSILAAALLDLLPEALEGDASARGLGLAFLIGVLLFFLLEKFLVFHHHSHGHEERLTPAETKLAGVRPLLIIGDTLHNLLDGIVIAIAFLADPSLGIITAIAIVAHEIPQEIGDFSVLLASGMRRSRVALWNIISAFVSPIGAVIGYVAGGALENSQPFLLAAITGSFLYIALADLVPTIKHEHRAKHSLGQTSFLLLGIVVVLLLTQWLHA